MSSFVILSHSGQRLVKGQLWTEVTGHDLGSYEGFTQYVPSHMRPFLFVNHISFCFLHSKW